MTNPYKVDYLSALKSKGVNKFMQYSVPLDEEELRIQLEALLIERHEQGYELDQILTHKPANHTGVYKNGMMVIFKYQNTEK